MKVDTEVTYTMYMLYIACDGWHEDIKQAYINRPRPSGWLCRELMAKALNEPTHVVDVGHKGSPTQHLEWRFSSALTEAQLMEN